MKVSDVMTRKVVSVAPDTEVPQLAKLLVEKHISAVPVIENGSLAGIVTEADLMRRPETGTERAVPWWYRLFAAPETLAQRFVKAHGLTANDVMTRAPVTIEPGASLAEAAELMDRHRVKRLLVVEGGRVAGIVARADLLRALAAAPHLSGTGEADGTIRAQLEDALERERWVPFDDLYVTVLEHTAHLWGSVPSQEIADAVVLLAKGVPGVWVVKSHLVLSKDTLRGPLLIA